MGEYVDLTSTALEWITDGCLPAKNLWLFLAKAVLGCGIDMGLTLVYNNPDDPDKFSASTVLFNAGVTGSCICLLVVGGLLASCGCTCSKAVCHCCECCHPGADDAHRDRDAQRTIHGRNRAVAVYTLFALARVHCLFQPKTLTCQGLTMSIAATLLVQRKALKIVVLVVMWFDTLMTFVSCVWALRQL